MKKQANFSSGDLKPRPLPAGWRLRRDPSTRGAAAGTVVFGGSPFRVLRLSPAGARTVKAWWGGASVGDGLAERELARRLLDAGLAHPDPPVDADAADVTVVVPVRDRPVELARCLAGIDRHCPVVVVDDGSADDEALGRVASEFGAQVVRLDPGRGPAAARNAGMRAARTPFVAFVDSDCVVPPGFPGRLLDHLGDPALAVAVPRIVPLEPSGRGILAGYEARHSSLDMGAREGLIRSGSAIPYAPSAALVVRVAALSDGFAEQLQMGEDVDLLWRLTDAGWQVRYDPAVTVAHDHRVGWRSWFTRRVAYNASTAVLARLHPGKVPPLVISRTGAVFWTATLVGRPAAAAAANGAGIVMLARRLRPYVPQPWRVATGLVVRGRLAEGRSVARALTGPWLPLLVVLSAARSRPARRVWLVIAVGAVSESAAPQDLIPRAADGVARCIGIWRGSVRERSAAALLPRLGRS
jgi:mycofactocin glycosyltransferase